MHRLLADITELQSDSPVLAKAAAKHLKVLRPEEGERIELFDGAGRWREFVFASGRLAPSGSVMSAPPPAPLTLFACVTKGSRWDWTVEKATELGATRIVPVISARTIVRIPSGEREAKRERWLRVAQDAARQSDAKWVPEVVCPVDFGESLALVRETKCFVGALVEPAPCDLLTALFKSKSDKPFSLFIGPEGDFTPEELAALTSAAEPVTFGEAILRAETASIYGLSVIKSFLESDVRSR